MNAAPGPRPRAGVAAMFAARAVDSCDDPEAAPGAYKGADRAPRRSFRRAVQNMVWIYVAGLVFLVFGWSSIADSGAGPVGVAVQAVLLALVAVSYVAAAWVCDASLRVRRWYLLGFVALLTCFSPWWGWSFVNQGVYVSILLATLIPWRESRIALIVLNLAIAAVALVTVQTTPVFIALIGSVVGLATGAGIEAGRIGARLHRAEQRVSTLAVAAERERIGRDLHDILGHSLTAISIKADLAEKLVDRDPAAARAEIAELSVVARQALADVRATASGIREVRVAGELASARSVLMAAGVQAVTPSAVEPLDDRTSELFGYVIREAITNVVRHSAARRCVITVSATAVAVVDDGVGPPRDTGGPGPAGPGSGLRGLAERVADAGGMLRVDQAPDGGTRVQADLAPARREPAGTEPSR